VYVICIHSAKKAEKLENILIIFRRIFMVLSILASLSNWVPSKKTTFSRVGAYLNERAIVTEIIQPGERGRVSFQATTWFAFCPYYVVLLPDTPVQVVEQHNATTLVVAPILFVVPHTSPSIDAA
jgi:membrane protein implicated in regulation of membrane protease activity